jgi:uncharacterized membrane protein
MYASHYVFSKGFFVAWIVVAIIWVWCTMLIAGFYPIIDGRKQILLVYRGLRGIRRVSEDNESGTETASSGILESK